MPLPLLYQDPASGGGGTSAIVTILRDLYPVVIRTFGVGTLAAVVGAILFLLWAFAARDHLFDTLSGRPRHPIAWALIVAVAATAGSLYLSEIMGFVPCQGCWYQRFAMFPLVLVLGLGLAWGSPRIWRFALPLPLLGLPISIYHIVVQTRQIEGALGCSEDAPCSQQWVKELGFVSIPMMAGAAFLLIISILLTLRVLERDGGRQTENGNE